MISPSAKVPRNKCSKSNIMPRAGDIVQVLSTDDEACIPVGAKGVILGKVSRTQTPVSSWDSKSVDVLFNWSPVPWWDNGFVNSSGGPQRIVKIKKLLFTGKTVKQGFHYFPHGIPGADRAKIRRHTVNVWEVNL